MPEDLDVAVLAGFHFAIGITVAVLGLLTVTGFTGGSGFPSIPGSLLPAASIAWPFGAFAFALGLFFALPLFGIAIVAFVLGAAIWYRKSWAVPATVLMWALSMILTAAVIVFFSVVAMIPFIGTLIPSLGIWPYAGFVVSFAVIGEVLYRRHDFTN